MSSREKCPRKGNSSSSEPKRPRGGYNLGQLCDDVRAQVLECVQAIPEKNRNILCNQGVPFCVAVSPDGRLIAIGGEDKTVRIWDVETGKEATGPLRGHTSIVLSVAFSPDGRRIASAGDRTVRIWDVETGQEAMGPLTGHSLAVQSVAWNHDGSLLASGSYDKTVKLWDLKTQELKCSLEGHTGEVLCVAFSPDGCRIASAGGRGDCTVRIWDVETGKEATGPLEGHGAFVRCVAFSPDGSQLASASDDKTVKLWDLSGETPVERCSLTGYTCGVMCVNFLDGRRIFSVSSDNTVRIWDVETGKEVMKLLKGHTCEVMCVNFNRDGFLLASSSEDGMVKMWDLWMEVMWTNELTVPIMLGKGY